MPLNSDIENRYRELLEKVVIRKPELKEFVNFLENETSWLISPASTKYHLNIEHGLLIHSVNVTDTMLMLKDVLMKDIP
ncbi:MAG TPA: phosphohydrolase, partial [bacterium]|nr:phosphohydrolase [bacterium]